VTDPSELRVSDDQREQAAREIREHFAAGRLTEDELSERLSAAYGAKTEQELRTISRDLPALPPSPAAQKAELVERRRHLQRRLLQEAGGGVAAFLVCTGIWLASGANGQFWPVWVAIVVVLVVVRSAWRLYGPAPELDRVEEELDRRAARRAGHRRRHR
jgi:hypothetical protein